VAPVTSAPSLILADADTRRDLATYVSRARRVDPDGAGRLVAVGGVLATYVSPVHGAPGPTVIGLRTLALADREAALDVTVPLAALSDRLAASAPDDLELPIPPTRAVDAGWAGISPPRSGWELRTALDPADLSRAARAGIDEIAMAVPEAVGGHLVTQVRAAVWGRDLPTLAGVAAGAAYAADALGFLEQHEPVSVRTAGLWWRLSTSRGHVLVRSALL
jgi:hypothetical protein